MMARFLTVLMLWCCLLAPAWAEKIAVPALNTRVTDLTATLSAPAKSAIEARLVDLEKRKGSQLAVLILPTTGEDTVEQFGIRVAEAWKLGRKGVDDGLLFLVAKDDRTLRIEVGYGLEGAIPDAVAKRVIEEIVVPRFKTGDFEGGIGAGVDSLIKLVDGEPLPAPAPSGSFGNTLEDLIPIAMVFVFVVGGILRIFFGPLLGAGIAAAVTLVGIWLLVGTFLVAVIVALVVFFLTLIGVSGGRRLGGGGGGGGGGFSGGGGGFGGGGASGRW